jgi:hypothetical protein
VDEASRARTSPRIASTAESWSSICQLPRHRSRHRIYKSTDEMSVEDQRIDEAGLRRTSGDQISERIARNPGAGGPWFAARPVRSPYCQAQSDKQVVRRILKSRGVFRWYRRERSRGSWVAKEPEFRRFHETPWVLTTAAVNYPSDPRAFLRRAAGPPPLLPGRPRGGISGHGFARDEQRPSGRGYARSREGKARIDRGIGKLCSTPRARGPFLP